MFTTGGNGGPRLTFGKYKNSKLSDVPPNYLRWVLSNFENLTERERGIIERALGRGTGSDYSDHQEHQERPHSENNYATASAALPAGVTVADLEMVVSAGRQSLAKRFHPDLPGGDVEEMKKINFAADFLLAAVRSLSPVGSRK